MIQIRNCVFETNSSSMHSIAILNEKAVAKRHKSDDDWYIGENGIMSFSGYDIKFDRSPFEILYTVRDKVRYAIASLCHNCEMYQAKEVVKEIENALHEYNNDIKGVSIETYDGYYYGYVDEDILTPFLKKNNISLSEFILNDKYIVIVDGDEYCVFDRMVDAGVIDLSAFDYVDLDDGLWW